MSAEELVLEMQRHHQEAARLRRPRAEGAHALREEHDVPRTARPPPWRPTSTSSQRSQRVPVLRATARRADHARDRDRPHADRRRHRRRSRPASACPPTWTASPSVTCKRAADDPAPDAGPERPRRRRGSGASRSPQLRSRHAELRHRRGRARVPDVLGEGRDGEDWDAWSDLFTEDVEYIEHILGSKHGREEVRNWIKPIMAEFGEMYTAYEWHMCEPSGRIVVYMQNRRDNPDPSAPPIDFPGMTVLQYAGDGKFSLEEDFWSLVEGQRTMKEYEEACAARPRRPEEAHPSSLGERSRLDEGRGNLRREHRSEEGRVTGTRYRERDAGASPDAGVVRAARGARRRRHPRRGPADRVLGPEDVRPAARVAGRPNARGHRPAWQVPDPRLRRPPRPSCISRRPVASTSRSRPRRRAARAASFGFGSTTTSRCWSASTARSARRGGGSSARARSVPSRGSAPSRNPTSSPS